MAKESVGLPSEVAELGVEMRVVRLEPGDLIVLTTPNRLTDQDCQDIRNRMTKFFGEYEVAIIEGGAQVQVVRKGGEPK